MQQVLMHKHKNIKTCAQDEGEVPAEIVSELSDVEKQAFDHRASGSE